MSFYKKKRVRELNDELAFLRSIRSHPQLGYEERRGNDEFEIEEEIAELENRDQFGEPRW